MNKYRKKLLTGMQCCTMMLLTLCVAASAKAQMSARASADDDRSEAGSGAQQPPRFLFSSIPLRAKSLPSNSPHTNIDKAVLKEFKRAWLLSGDGMNGREGVVLIFRMKDGSYTGGSPGFTNEYRRFTLKWNPAALAIVHTHPNGSDPKPSAQDRRVADKYGVLNFTITIHGMYVYDPASKKTCKVLNGTDWLNLSTMPDELKSWFIDLNSSLPQVSETGNNQNIAAYGGKQCQ